MYEETNNKEIINEVINEVIDETIDETIDFTGKKKKKKIINKIVENDDYSYTELLNRFYTLCSVNQTTNEEKIKIPFPKIGKSSNKTIFVNFQDVCSKMHRNLQHVSKFISSELNCVVSLNMQNSLIIRGKYTINNIQTILSKYLTFYVKCSNCKDMATQLLKDSEKRLYYIQCDKCLSKKYIK